jgi:hypothetical protein
VNARVGAGPRSSHQSSIVGESASSVKRSAGSPTNSPDAHGPGRVGAARCGRRPGPQRSLLRGPPAGAFSAGLDGELSPLRVAMRTDSFFGAATAPGGARGRRGGRGDARGTLATTSRRRARSRQRPPSALAWRPYGRWIWPVWPRPSAGLGARGRARAGRGGVVGLHPARARAHRARGRRFGGQLDLAQVRAVPGRIRPVPVPHHPAPAPPSGNPDQDDHRFDFARRGSTNGSRSPFTPIANMTGHPSVSLGGTPDGRPPRIQSCGQR